MYERIILTDDGSPLSRAAIPRAAALAAAGDADVLVIRVSEAAGVKPDDLDDDGWDAYLSDEAAEQAAADPLEAEPHLSEVVADLHARGVTHVGSLVVHGEPGEALVEAADELDADLIVVSSRGMSGIRRAVLGSVAEQIIRNARSVPVLLSPPPADGPEPEIHRVLLPLDGSDLSQTAVPHAEYLARALGAELTLIQVTDSEAGLLAASMPVGAPPRAAIPVDAANQIAAEQRAEADVALTSVATAMQERGVANVATEVVAGEPTEAILEAVDRLGIDVVVMATHGRGGLGRLLLGSVADAVARNTERSAVLLIRPSEDD